MQHRRWDFHEGARVKSVIETHFFQTGPRTSGIDEGTFGNPKP